MYRVHSYRLKTTCFISLKASYEAFLSLWKFGSYYPGATHMNVRNDFTSDTNEANINREK